MAKEVKFLNKLPNKPYLKSFLGQYKSKLSNYYSASLLDICLYLTPLRQVLKSFF